MFRGLELPLVGREQEIELFSKSIDKVKKGKGTTLSLAGEAGIGKTRLVEEFTFRAEEEGFKVLTGMADINSLKPFDIFSKALEDEIGEPLFKEVENTSFAEIFAVNNAGLLLATALPGEEEELDGDIFAGMLSAVQNFVKDSFDRSGDTGAGLGRLEYGDMKILIEHGEEIYVAAVIKGREHPDMKRDLAKTVKDIEIEDSNLMEDWSGDMEEMQEIQNKISKLSDIPYAVRKDLEGIKLENERLKMADRIVQVLCDISEKQPILLLLEDLQWTDESSLSIIDYISRNILDEEILVLCTLRPNEGPHALQTLQTLCDDNLLDFIELTKLGQDCIKKLVDEIYRPNDFPEAMIERLSQDCKGNPFFVIELLKQMQQEGNIEKTEGKYELLEDMMSVPTSVEEVVHRRLELLDSGSIDFVEYAACEGGEINKEIIEWFDPNTDNSIKNLVDSGILLPNNGDINFSHAIFRDVIYSSLPGWWKNIHHKKLGEFYETNYSGRIHEVYYDLARHFSNTNQHEKGHDYSYKAGEKAENALAPEQAIEFYNKSLEALNNLRMVEGKVERRCNILERIGDMSGLLGDFEDAVTEYDKVLETTKDKSIQATLHRKLGNVFMNTGDYQRSLKECDSALELLENDDPEIAKVKRVKGRTYMRTGDYDVSLDLLTQAFDIAHKNKDGREMAEIAHNQGTVEWYRGEYDQALEHLEHSLDLRNELDDTRGKARASTNIGIVYYSRGDMKRALDHYEEALRSFKKIGDKLNLASVYINMGMAYFKLGELQRAADFFEICLDLFKRVGDKGSVASSLNNLGLVLQDMGEPIKALNYHQEGLQIREEIGDKQGTAMSLHNIGKVYFDICEMDKAIKNMTKGLEISTEINNLYLSVEILCSITEAEIVMGEMEDAKNNAKKALNLSVDIESDSLEGLSRIMLGTVYREMERWESAQEEFEKAKTILENSDEKKDLASLLYEYGVLWKVMGEDDKGRNYLEKALNIQKELNLKRDMDKTRNMLDSI